MIDTSGREMGFGWARDKVTDTLADVLKSGIDFFQNKYDGKIKNIYCSKKDVAETFIYQDIQVIPVQNVLSGSILIYGE
jgi:hypothetical protein